MSTNLLTPQELADRLSVGPATIYRWHKDGTIPGISISRKVLRFRYEDVIDFLKADKGGTR